MSVLELGIILKVDRSGVFNGKNGISENSLFLEIVLTEIVLPTADSSK